MRTTIVLITLAFVFFAGCTAEPGAGAPAPPFGQSDASVYARYAPTRIDVLPLTGIVAADASTRDSLINVYVSMLDSFDSQIKTPGVFRFELFEQLQRSTAPKGKRLAIWPDLDLTDPAANNSHWQDFLRAYHFALPFQQTTAGAYILQATCLCPTGRRLTADFLIRPPKRPQ